MALDPPIAVILDYYGFGFLVLLSVLFLPRAVLGRTRRCCSRSSAPPVVALITGAVDFEQIPDPLQLFARWLFYGDYPMFVWFAFLLAGLILGRDPTCGNRLTAGIAIVAGHPLGRARLRRRPTSSRA